MSHPFPLDPLHTKVCLTGMNCRCPSISVFMAPEPLVRGGCMLHLVEQDPVAERKRIPERDSELVALIQAAAMPLSRHDLVHTQLLAFHPARHESARIRAVLNDHLISDPAPVGLDADDPAELARLEELPEHRIGLRRIDDFQAHSVRQAMAAVYRHFEIDQRIPLVYHGYADPTEGWFALRASSA